MTVTRAMLDETTVLGRDEVGIVAEADGFRYYLTDCCGASAKGCGDGVTACRACYEEIDDALGGCPERDTTSPWFRPFLEVYGDGIPWTAWAERVGIAIPEGVVT